MTTTTTQTQPVYVLKFANHVFLEFRSSPRRDLTRVKFGQNCPSNRWYYFEEDVQDVYASLNLFPWNTPWETLDEYLAANCMDYDAIDPNYVIEFKTGEIFEFFENSRQIQVFINKEDNFYTLKSDFDYRQKIKEYSNNPVLLHAWLKTVEMKPSSFNFL